MDLQQQIKDAKRQYSHLKKLIAERKAILKKRLRSSESCSRIKKSPPSEHQLVKLDFYIGDHVVYRIDAKEGKYTRQDVQRYVKELLDELHTRSPNWTYAVSLLYPDGWKSGYFAPSSEYPAVLYQCMHTPDPPIYRGFSMYVAKSKPIADT